MYYAFAGLYVLVCLFLLGVVLLQQGRGGDIAAAFGGSSSQTAFGARSGATVLTRATAVLGTLFMLGAFGLGIMGKGGGSSVVSGVQGPAQTAPAAPALPMTTPLPSATPATGGSAPTPTTTPGASPAPTTSPAAGGSKPAATPTPAAKPTPTPGRSSGS
jgi:preprotein translocase subunit SecG